MTLPLTAVAAGLLTTGFSAIAHAAEQPGPEVETIAAPAPENPADELLDALLGLVGGLLGRLPESLPPPPALPVAAGTPEQLPPLPLALPAPAPAVAPAPAPAPGPEPEPWPLPVPPLPDLGSLLPRLLPPLLPPAPAQSGASDPSAAELAAPASTRGELVE